MVYFQFNLIQPDIPVWANVLSVIANIINLVYNFPQMWTTYKRKTTKDISATFLLLRVVSSAIWIAYSFAIGNGQLIIANAVTLLASIFIGFYKVREMTQTKYSRLPDDPEKNITEKQIMMEVMNEKE